MTIRIYPMAVPCNQYLEVECSDFGIKHGAGPYKQIILLNATKGKCAVLTFKQGVRDITVHKPGDQL